MILKETKNIDVEQGTDEWLHIRKASITSTDIAKATPRAGDVKTMVEKFIAFKNAAQVDLSGNVHVQMGREKEEEILQNFINGVYTTQIPRFDLPTFKHGEVYTRAIEFKTDSGEYSNQLLSSHDGTISDEEGNVYIVEAKYSTAEYNFARDDYVLPSYLKQVAHHLVVNQNAIGCFLVLSNCAPDSTNLLTNIHYFPRDDERIQGVGVAILDLATSVHVISKDEGESTVLFWQLAKSRSEIKKKFDKTAEELAQLTEQYRSVKRRITALELQLKSLPFEADYHLEFPEYHTKISLDMIKKTTFNSDKYADALCLQMQEKGMEIPSRKSFFSNMSYQVLSVKKL